MRVSNALLLDSRVVARAEGLILKVGKVAKDHRNPLMSADRPWEERLDNVYANVQFDSMECCFKCWYSPFIVDEAVSGTPVSKRAKTSYANARRLAPHREMALCYATSTDGITWLKPKLHLYDFLGSRENNLVLRFAGPRLDGPHGAGVIQDLHDSDLARRYKALFSMDRRLWVASSPDGLHWSTPDPGIGADLAGDTHNNMVWSPHRQAYVAFSRAWANGVRQVVRTESSDLRTWSEPKLAIEGIDAQHQTYAMLVFPYADMYIGLLMIFDTLSDCVHCELASSIDTISWNRICPGQPFIENGVNGHCDSGCVYAAGYPIMQENMVLLYYGSSDKPHSNWRDSYLCRATMPLDRWAGYAPVSPTKPGTLLTQPLLFTGERLAVNAENSDGTVQVELLGTDGQVLEESTPVRANGTSEQIRWKSGRSLSEYGGRPTRLRFAVDRACIYSFKFL
jgi:hypothetical protein